MRNEKGDFLMIERMKFPPGYALPAGHLDGDEPENGAKRELKEEVGVIAEELKLLLNRKMDNPCRREGGDWHEWWVFEAVSWSGDIKRSLDETKQARWVSMPDLLSLAARTEEYVNSKILESEWESNPGLEEVWYRIFKILEII